MQPEAREHQEGPPGPPRKREPGAPTPGATGPQRSADTKQHNQPQCSKPVGRRQIPAVGTVVDVDVLLVDSLLWGHPDDADEVLRLVHDDDVRSPHLAAILTAIREMLDAGTPVSPQLVLDRISRAGVQRPVHQALIRAATAGACPEAVREYAAAVVAATLRRRVESGGHAMCSAADDLSEAELPMLVAEIAVNISGIAARLAALRQEEVDR